MKYILLSLGFIFSSCGHLSQKEKSEAMKTARDYAVAHLKDPRVETDQSGNIILGDTHIRYVIRPENVIKGLIDEDVQQDILVTIDTLMGQNEIPSVHLIINRSRNSLHILCAIRSDMKILAVKKRIITADIPTHTPDSPLYFCPDCRDTTEYLLVKCKLEKR